MKIEPVQPKIGDIWHRVEDYREGSMDGEYGHVSVSVKLRKMRYQVAKVTPKGVWLTLGLGSLVSVDDKHFVRLDARRRYAHPSEQEAMESFVARKQRQIRILETQLKNVKSALSSGQFDLKVMQQQPGI